METTYLIQIPDTIELTALADADIEAFFAAAGLAAGVVAHCDTAGCAVCFAELIAEAA